ncbi:MAG: hypothetical protein ACK50R_02805 [Planctomycetota bacterium]
MAKFALMALKYRRKPQVFQVRQMVEVLDMWQIKAPRSSRSARRICILAWVLLMGMLDVVFNCQEDA